MTKTFHSLKHVALIMDGNGRWAQQRYHNRLWGHIRGASKISPLVRSADRLSIDSLTLYAFSTENWSRPETEIRGLFKILKKFLIKEKKSLVTNQVRFKVVGEISGLPNETLKLIHDLEEETKGFSGLKLNFAFGYGSRQEILKAVQQIQREDFAKIITEQEFSRYLNLPECGDVDLLIRTGGDQRLSNFLLWELAYAELYFTSTLWPDFTVKEFEEIIREVAHRQRRFGGLTGDSSFQESVERSQVQKIRLKRES